jgi:hypothetical protein
MTGLLALGGEAHLVIRDQIFGRCIHHAVPVRAPLFAILTVAISVIESPLETLLVMLASDPLPCGAHDGGAGRAVATAPVVPAAHHEAAMTTRALALDTDLEHREPTPKSWLPREPTRYCAHHRCAFRRMLSQQPEGSER